MSTPAPNASHPLTAGLCQALLAHEPDTAICMVDYHPGETSVGLDGWWHTDDVERILRELPRASIPEPPAASTVIFRPGRRVRDMLRDFIALGLYSAATRASTTELHIWVRRVFESTHADPPQVR